MSRQYFAAHYFSQQYFGRYYFGSVHLLEFAALAVITVSASAVLHVIGPVDMAALGIIHVNATENGAYFGPFWHDNTQGSQSWTDTNSPSPWTPVVPGQWGQ